MQQAALIRPTTTERVRKHRAALRLAGLKPVQLWLPDGRSESFRLKCEQEARLAASDALEVDTLAWIAEAADTEGWV
jgi:hypothetical protein